MDHHVVAHIDAAVGNAGNAFAHGAVKEHNVAGLSLIHRYIPAQTPQPLGSQPAGVVDTAGREHIADKAGAVKAGFRARAAPYIGIADILGGFLHELREGRIRVQRFLRNVIQHGILQRNRVRPVEDALHVAVGCHVQGVHAHGVMAHADDRQMAQILV